MQWWEVRCSCQIFLISAALAVITSRLSEPIACYSWKWLQKERYGRGTCRPGVNISSNRHLSQGLLAMDDDISSWLSVGQTSHEQQQPHLGAHLKGDNRCIWCLLVVPLFSLMRHLSWENRKMVMLMTFWMRFSSAHKGWGYFFVVCFFVFSIEGSLHGNPCKRCTMNHIPLPQASESFRGNKTCSALINRPLWQNHSLCLGLPFWPVRQPLLSCCLFHVIRAFMLAVASHLLISKAPILPGLEFWI